MSTMNEPTWALPLNRAEAVTLATELANALLILTNGMDMCEIGSPLMEANIELARAALSKMQS